MMNVAEIATACRMNQPILGNIMLLIISITSHPYPAKPTGSIKQGESQEMNEPPAK